MDSPSIAGHIAETGDRYEPDSVPVKTLNGILAEASSLSLYTMRQSGNSAGTRGTLSFRHPAYRLGEGRKLLTNRCANRRNVVFWPANP